MAWELVGLSSSGVRGNSTMRIFLLSLQAGSLSRSPSPMQQPGPTLVKIEARCNMFSGYQSRLGTLR